MSLIEKLKAGKKNVKPVLWPGTDETVRLAVLTEAEIQQALFETEKKFKAAGIEFSVATADAYQSEQNTQTLALALLDERGGRLFKTADELRPLLQPSVKDVLIEEFNAWQQECSPSLTRLGDEEFDKLFEDIKKNPSTSNGLSLRTLRELIIYLASRPATSPQASGSTSS
jgi:hypothetical protein